MVSLSQQVINIKQNNERDGETKSTKTKAKTARRPATSTATQSAEGRAGSSPACLREHSVRHAEYLDDKRSISYVNYTLGRKLETAATQSSSTARCKGR
ncbi:hypothetical protein TESG_08285 [Trichophyton tonsurans CBS 112818]|uniref:Uncharacterized protein n=1 Tax=Trichophyton tonsurans (strain CBS 112818) TaxID=647933 RepID=F2RQG7_TRIT1|nr:hypothetical protein TESG_08285 [Trichophyton tonsurans CBS 112818]